MANGVGGPHGQDAEVDAESVKRDAFELALTLHRKMAASHAPVNRSRQKHAQSFVQVNIFIYLTSITSNLNKHSIMTLFVAIERHNCLLNTSEGVGEVTNYILQT